MSDAIAQVRRKFIELLSGIAPVRTGMANIKELNGSDELPVFVFWDGSDSTKSLFYNTRDFGMQYYIKAHDGYAEELDDALIQIRRTLLSFIKSPNIDGVPAIHETPATFAHPSEQARLASFQINFLVDYCQDQYP